MPTFCRHNRLVQNCRICRAAAEPEPTRSRPARGRGATSGSQGRSGGVRVLQAARESDDGHRNALTPGIKSAADAQRLGEEIAFASARLGELATDPPGLYADIASAGDVEEATWLAFLIAYLSPLEDEDPWSSVRVARVPWSSGELPALQDATAGPRGAHGAPGAAGAVSAYRAWAARSGSQAAAFLADSSWSPERRFARVFERLSLPGFGQPARMDLLLALGRLGVYDMTADSLHVGAAGRAQVAAKRILGIGDPLLLERRAAAVAEACEVPVEALDLALWNWQRGPEEPRTTLGAGPAARAATAPGPAIVAALGIETA